MIYSGKQSSNNSGKHLKTNLKQEKSSSLVIASLFRKHACKGKTSCVLSSLPLQSPFPCVVLGNSARHIPLAFFSMSSSSFSRGYSATPNPFKGQPKAEQISGVPPPLVSGSPAKSLRLRSCHSF